jgi:hypothetical protein
VARCQHALSMEGSSLLRERQLQPQQHQSGCPLTCLLAAQPCSMLPLLRMTGYMCK